MTSRMRRRIRNDCVWMAMQVVRFLGDFEVDDHQSNAYNVYEHEPPPSKACLSFETTWSPMYFTFKLAINALQHKWKANDTPLSNPQCQRIHAFQREEIQMHDDNSEINEKLKLFEMVHL